MIYYAHSNNIKTDVRDRYMKYPEIRLRRGKEESLMRFHPWVFSGAIESLPDGVEEGDVVQVTSHEGDSLGVGHYQIGSIAVRMLSDKPVDVDAEFYASRLAEAFKLRETLGLIREDNNAYRLVHGEGDFLPGLIVDVYGSTAVLQAHSPGMHYARNILADALVNLAGAGIKNVYYKSDASV